MSVPPPEPPEDSDTVFSRKKLRHIHLEPFRPANLNYWEPETESDVYLAFGVLQEFTDYQYCCGASKALLVRLGAYEEGVTKPDAILIDRATGLYLMAEWKMRSSQFVLNHHREDVDVLVCWKHDAGSAADLPHRILALSEVAMQAASEEFLAGEVG